MLPRSFFDGIELGRLAIFLYPLLVPKPSKNTQERKQPTTSTQPTDFFIIEESV